MSAVSVNNEHHLDEYWNHDRNTAISFVFSSSQVNYYCRRQDNGQLDADLRTLEEKCRVLYDKKYILTLILPGQF